MIKNFTSLNWTQTSVKILLLGLIALLYLGRSLNGIKENATGDGVEYVLTTEALYNHFTPDIRYSDAVSFREAYCKKQEWKLNLSADAFDIAERALKSGDPEECKRLGTVTDHLNRHYGYHFFFYSILTVPVRAIIGATEGNPLKTFQITNACVVIITCFFLLFFSSFSFTQTLLFTLSFCFTSIYWYLGWTHTEVFMVCVLTLGMWFFYQKKFYLGLFLVSLGALQYQPVVIILLYMVIVILIQQGFRLRNLIWIALTCSIVLWPPLFYLIHFGTTNLIGNEPGFMSVQNTSSTRVFGFYFDANQGMILGLPIALIIYMVLCARKWLRMALRREPFDFSTLLPVFILLTTYVVSMISLWSPVGAVINRYATWMAAAILVHVFFLLNEFRFLLKYTIMNYIFATQVFVTLFFDQYNECGWNFGTNGVLAAWFIEEHPSLYNPDPQIFILRTSYLFDFSPANSPVIYMKNKNEMCKMIVHRDRLDDLVEYGFSKGQIDTIRLENKFINDWTYINRGDFRLTLTDEQLYQLVRRKRLSAFEAKIRSSPSWYRQMEQKARERNTPVDEVIRIDAEYLMQQEEQATREGRR